MTTGSSGPQRSTNGRRTDGRDGWTEAGPTPPDDRDEDDVQTGSRRSTTTRHRSSSGS